MDKIKYMGTLHLGTPPGDFDGEFIVIADSSSWSRHRDLERSSIFWFWCDDVGSEREERCKDLCARTLQEGTANKELLSYVLDNGFIRFLCRYQRMELVYAYDSLTTN